MCNSLILLTVLSESMKNLDEPPTIVPFWYKSLLQLNYLRLCERKTDSSMDHSLLELDNFSGGKSRRGVTERQRHVTCKITPLLTDRPVLQG